MFKETIPEQGGTCNSYRLCAPASDRNAWNNLDAEWKKAVIWHAEPYLHFTWPYLSATDYLDFTRTGDRMRFEKRYFIKRDVLDSLVLAECVEHQGRFMDDIVNGIFAICDESAWDLPPHNNYPDRGQIPLPDVNAPVIDLFACETGAILGAVLYLLKDELDDFSPYVADRIRYELNRRIYEPYLHRYSHWMGDGKNPLNNWTVWCTQNVLLSVFLPDTEKELRKRVVKQACQSVDYWMDQYGEDGCCNEGSSYYHHAGLCLMIILDLLGHTVDPAFFDLARTPKIQNIASYIYKVHVADRYYINYADGSAVGERCGVREFLLAQMTGDRDMQAFAAADYQAGLPETLLTIREHNLVYRLMGGFHAAQMKYYDVSELKNPPDVWYPSNGLMIVRDDRFVCAAKAGNNADSHNHNDVGSFTIYKDGKPLLIDVGVETYCRKTFSPQRYEIWTMQSAWHNLPTIDGVMQAPGEEFRATGVQCELDKAQLSMELQEAYPLPALASWNRTVRLEKGKEITVDDRFSFRDSGKHEVVCSLMVYDQPAVSDDHRTISLRPFGEASGDVHAVLHLDGGEVTAVEAVPVTDARLAQAWKHALHRILVKPLEGSSKIRLTIC